MPELLKHVSMRGFGRRGVVVRPVVVAPVGGGGGPRRRGFRPLRLIPIVLAIGIIAYFVMKQMG